MVDSNTDQDDVADDEANVEDLQSPPFLDVSGGTVMVGQHAGPHGCTGRSRFDVDRRPGENRQRTERF